MPHYWAGLTIAPPKPRIDWLHVGMVLTLGFAACVLVWCGTVLIGIGQHHLGIGAVSVGCVAAVVGSQARV